jgi:putative methionine-R-sulfoxide reductase with GAF domain
MHSLRDYAPLHRLINQAELPADRTARMQAVVDMLWDHLHPTGVSWVGFYIHEGKDELVCGPRRNKPACSPIGLHGACGKAFRTGTTLVIDDVKELGENYIACDPKDRSELVIPLFDGNGRTWGVLDLDSYDVGAFSNVDARALNEILITAGLTV